MQATPEFAFKFLKFRPHPFGNRVTQPGEFSFAGFAAYVGKPEKVKCLRFSVALTFAIARGKAAELDQPCFAIVKLQVELAKTFLERLQESQHRSGADGMTAEQMLRVGIVKQMFGFTHKELAFHIVGSKSLGA